MMTKVMRAGNLFPYLDSTEDDKGEPREQPAFLLRGSPGLALDFLRRKSPRFRRWSLKNPGFVKHCQTHLLHIISCFSETDVRVREVLPHVIEGTENLILLGLPKDALDFVWYEHAKAKGSHAHCAMTQSLLPAGGPFQYRNHAELVQCFDRLASHALGLSDPLDPKRARLVCAARYSNTKENEYDIKRICRETALWWENRKIEHNHSTFIELLGRDLGYPILLVPDQNGKGRRTEEGPTAPAIEPLRCVVVVQALSETQSQVAAKSATKRLIYLKGEVCRPWFSAREWVAELKERENAFHLLRDHPLLVYERFERLLRQQIRKRHQDYRGFFRRLNRGIPVVGIDDFSWLKPSKPLPGCREVSGPVQEDPLSWELDSTYPFHSDYEDTIWEAAEDQFVTLADAGRAHAPLELTGDSEHQTLAQPQGERGQAGTGTLETLSEDPAVEGNLAYLDVGSPYEELVIWPGFNRLAAHFKTAAEPTQPAPLHGVLARTGRASQLARLKRGLRRLAIAVRLEMDAGPGLELTIPGLEPTRRAVPEKAAGHVPISATRTGAPPPVDPVWPPVSEAAGEYNRAGKRDYRRARAKLERLTQAINNAVELMEPRDALRLKAPGETPDVKLNSDAQRELPVEAILSCLEVILPVLRERKKRRKREGAPPAPAPAINSYLPASPGAAPSGSESPLSPPAGGGLEASEAQGSREHPAPALDQAIIRLRLGPLRASPDQTRLTFQTMGKRVVEAIAFIRNSPGSGTACRKTRPEAPESPGESALSRAIPRLVAALRAEEQEVLDDLSQLVQCLNEAFEPAPQPLRSEALITGPEWFPTGARETVGDFSAENGRTWQRQNASEDLPDHSIQVVLPREHVLRSLLEHLYDVKENLVNVARNVAEAAVAIDYEVIPQNGGEGASASGSNTALAARPPRVKNEGSSFAHLTPQPKTEPWKARLAWLAAVELKALELIVGLSKAITEIGHASDEPTQTSLENAGSGGTGKADEVVEVDQRGQDRFGATQTGPTPNAGGQDCSLPEPVLAKRTSLSRELLVQINDFGHWVRRELETDCRGPAVSETLPACENAHVPQNNTQTTTLDEAGPGERTEVKTIGEGQPNAQVPPQNQISGDETLLELGSNVNELLESLEPGLQLFTEVHHAASGGILSCTSQSIYSGEAARRTSPQDTDPTVVVIRRYLAGVLKLIADLRTVHAGLPDDSHQHERGNVITTPAEEFLAEDSSFPECAALLIRLTGRPILEFEETLRRLVPYPQPGSKSGEPVTKEIVRAGVPAEPHSIARALKQVLSVTRNFARRAINSLSLVAKITATPTGQPSVGEMPPEQLAFGPSVEMADLTDVLKELDSPQEITSEPTPATTIVNTANRLLELSFAIVAQAFCFVRVRKWEEQKLGRKRVQAAARIGIKIAELSASTNVHSPATPPPGRPGRELTLEIGLSSAVQTRSDPGFDKGSAPKPSTFEQSRTIGTLALGVDQARRGLSGELPTLPQQDLHSNRALEIGVNTAERYARSPITSGEVENKKELPQVRVQSALDIGIKIAESSASTDTHSPATPPPGRSVRPLTLEIGLQSAAHAESDPGSNRGAVREPSTFGQSRTIPTLALGADQTRSSSGEIPTSPQQDLHSNRALEIGINTAERYAQSMITSAESKKESMNTNKESMNTNHVSNSRVGIRVNAEAFKEYLKKRAALAEKERLEAQEQRRRTGQKTPKPPESPSSDLPPLQAVPKPRPPAPKPPPLEGAEPLPVRPPDDIS